MGSKLPNLAKGKHGSIELPNNSTMSNEDSVLMLDNPKSKSTARALVIINEVHVTKGPWIEVRVIPGGGAGCQKTFWPPARGDFFLDSPFHRTLG